MCTITADLLQIYFFEGFRSGENCMNDTDIILPASQSNNVPIVLASSDYYVPFMTVTVQSVIERRSENFFYDFILLHSGISEEAQYMVASIAKGIDNVSIRFVEVTSDLSKYSYNFREGYTQESFYRIVMMDILSSYDKAIYLDCDVIAVSDVAELFQMDLGDNLVAAARDIDGISNWYFDHDGRRNYISDIMGLKDPEEYFQSGVVLFNLKELRNTFQIQEIIEVTCAPQIVWGDQDALNILCNGRVKYLGLEWNTIVNYRGVQINNLFVYGPPCLLQEYLDARRQPKIIHYAGTKPWNELRTDMFQYFWEIARNTPFYETIYFRLKENMGSKGSGTGQRRSNIRRIADKLFPKGSVRRERLKKILPKGSRRWDFLKRIFRFALRYE